VLSPKGLQNCSPSGCQSIAPYPHPLANTHLAAGCLSRAIILEENRVSTGRDVSATSTAASYRLIFATLGYTSQVLLGRRVERR
jgi:hypothetical protein